MIYSKRMKLYTVNVDIFECIDFQGFMTMVNFACVKTPVSSITGYYQNKYAITKQISMCTYFRGCLKNTNCAKICTTWKRNTYQKAVS